MRLQGIININMKFREAIVDDVWKLLVGMGIRNMRLGAEVELHVHRKQTIDHIMKKSLRHRWAQIELRKFTVIMVIKESPKDPSGFGPKVSEIFDKNKMFPLIIHSLRKRFKGFYYNSKEYNDGCQQLYVWSIVLLCQAAWWD